MRTLALVAVASLFGCTHSEPAPDPGPSQAGGGGSTPIAHLMIPPEEGKSRFVAEGCAAKPEEADKSATRGGLSGSEKDKVEASALGTGIVVSHDLAHACCLKADSVADIQGSSVVITETLSGTPCRCICSSTLKTAVGLKKGTWQVSVKTVEGGNSKTAWTGELTVK